MILDPDVIGAAFLNSSSEKKLAVLFGERANEIFRVIRASASFVFSPFKKDECMEYNWSKLEGFSIIGVK